MLFFLQKVYKAIDEDGSSEIVAFYTDFSKAFEKVPHIDLLCKVAESASEDASSRSYSTT